MPPPFAARCAVCHRRPITTSPHARCAEVGTELTFEVIDHVAMALQVAVASTAGAVQAEELVVTLDGRTIAADVVTVDHRCRVHVVRCGPGRLDIRCDATLERATAEARGPGVAETLVALRQSRYCPSDALESYGPMELGWLPEGPERGRAVGAWVHRRLRDELGSNGALDIAIDTLLAGRGGCRDFAHLTIALCRALGVPERLVSVYAPGLSPMDFHAVAELLAANVFASVDGLLPDDDDQSVVTLA